MKGIYNPISIIKTKKYRKKNKNFGKFPFSRTRGIYAEDKENGKTITATKTILERLEEYPKAIFITNVYIKGIKNKTMYFKNSEELVEILKNCIKPEERERIFNIYRRNTCCPG